MARWFRSSLSETRPFVCRCLTSPTPVTDRANSRSGNRRLGYLLPCNSTPLSSRAGGLMSWSETKRCAPIARASSAPASCRPRTQGKAGPSGCTGTRRRQSGPRGPAATTCRPPARARYRIPASPGPMPSCRPPAGQPSSGRRCGGWDGGPAQLTHLKLLVAGDVDLQIMSVGARAGTSPTA